MKSFKVTTPTNLKDFTDSVYPQGSFYYSALIRSGDIRVNGAKVRASVPLKEGDEVTYYTTPSMEAKPSHRVIYADERLVAVDKFSGVSTEALACELSLIPVHRLDRNTCGVLLFARDREGEESLVKLFKERAVQKEYVCICRDNFRRDEDDMTAYIKKDARRSLVTVSRTPSRGSLPMRTQYKVLRRQSGLAEVRVVLHTGRTHQIRAHMAFIGCPVLGDEKYGDERLNAKYALKRQQLCSYRLSFALGGRRYSFTSSLAPHFPPAVEPDV